MPIYEYKGQQYDITTEDPAEAKAKILGFLEKQPPAPAPRVPDFAGNAAMSPQEQAYAATPKAGIASLRTPSAVPEMTQYTPSLPEMLMGLLPGDKAKAANEYAARKAAEERGVSTEEIYKGAGGARPMFNPEGRAPILAGTQAGTVIAKELPNIPQQTAVAALQAVRAGDIGAPGQETFLDKAINYMTPETPKGEQDKNYDAFQGLSKSLGFSLTTMVSSIVGAAAGTSVAGFPGGVAGGMGASGTVAYRSSKDDFLSRVRDKLNQESIKLYNKPISGSDWENAKKEFDSAASSYGAWEAVPEALSNAIMLKAFTGPARAAAGAGRLEQFMVKNNIAEKVASYATENITETTTGLGQRAAELRAGLTKEEMTIADAFRQQFVQTLLVSGGMQVGEKATHMASQFYQNKIEPRINPGSALGKAIMADLNAVEFSQSAINKEAIARLTPQKYQQEKLATEKVAKTARGIAMPPPPEEKLVEPPAAKPPVEPAGIAGLTAAPSESMDTEAMLREALGQAPAGVATLPPVKVEEPKAAFNPTGWTQKENKINEKTGEPTYKPGTMVFEKTDEAGSHRVVTRNGEISQSTTNSPVIEIINSYLTSDEDNGKISGKIQIDNKTGKLIFVEDGERGQVIKMSPRAEQQYKEGVPLEKIAETEFSDAGGIRPDGTRTPHTTTAAFKAQKPSAVIPTAQQPKTSTEIQPTVAEAGPFVRKQMEAQTPTTPTPVSIEGALSGIETPKAKQAEAQEQQAPAAPVTLYRGVPKGQEKRETVGGAQFMSPDRKVAEMYAGPEGAVSEEVYSFKNPLQAPTWVDAKSKLGLPQSATMADLVNAARKAGHDGVTFNTTNGPEYIVIKKQATTEKPAAKEGFNWTELLNPNEQKYYDTFQNTASPEAKAAFDKVGSSIQDVTTALNNLGYQVTDKKFPLGLGNLKTQYTNLVSDGLQLLASHNDLQNKPANADKFNIAIKRANDSVAQAQQVIRKAVPRPEEITEAEQRVTEGEKAVSRIKGKPGRSLWTALTGKLGASDIAELFGRSPQIYQKKLQAKKDTSGKSIADMVSDGDLDDFLPFQMRSSVPGFDGQEAEEYIKDQVRGQNYIPYDAQVEIEQIFGSVEEAEKLINDYLTIEEQNLELQEAADEERQGEINARSVEPESEIPSAEPDEGETLTKPTPEGLRAKEKYRTEAEAKEAAEAKANKEAGDRAKADREVGEFTLTGSDRAADIAVAQGQKDIFGKEEAAEEAPVNEDGVKVVPFEADSETVGKLLSETREEENSSDIRRNALMHSTEKPAKPKPTEMLTPEEAKAQIDEWKAEAARQGKTNKNYNKTILSLFDASGEWAKPWYEAGYDVHTFDIQTGEDINDFSAEYLLENGYGDLNIWGILAAPPCTDFASSGAQFWAKKDAKGQTEISNELVMQVIRTVNFLQPKIWAMENPVGRIAKLNNLPPAHLTFDPNYYGDPYTKKTLLWGNFENNLPLAPVEPTEGSKIVKLSGKDKYARSLTPEGFAYAFFMANNAESMTPAERLTRTYYGVDPKAFEGATEADEEAIDSSLFQDKYYDGELDEAADIARNIIGGQQEIQEELPSEDYQKAMDESNKAIKAFNKIQEAYRAQEIGDDEFLAGRKVYDAAMKKFDEAYAAEQEPAEPAKTPTTALATIDNKAILKDALRIHELNIDLQQISGDDGKKIEDYSAKEIYSEAKYILGLFLESGTMDNDAYIGEHGPEEQKAAKDSVKKLQALVKKYADIEVLEPEEKPAAPRLTNEPYTIEGEFTEIGEEKQHALLTDQTSKLSEDQNKSLESQYGAKRNSAEFLDSLRKDVIAFITEGAKAVNGKIRAIIKQIATGVLSVAIVFNPQFVSKPYTIAVPQYDIKTSEVIKDLPKEAQSMSDAAKRAYGVIYPALEKQLKEKDKLFIVADKRSGNTYLFNPDGSLLLQSKTLFGKAIGDYMHGDNEIEANRITPAGVFDLGLRDAKRSEGEAYTAGDYDFGKVFVLDKSHMGSNGPYSNTIMHSVWTNETDAKQRLAALDKPGAEDSRYSFGCINVNKETFKYLITNHLNQMDGAKIFIVPENGANVMDFINGKAMNSDDIIRQKVEPITKTTITEKQVPAPQPGVERKQTGRETELAKLEVKTEEEVPGKEPKEPENNTFYSLDAYVNEEESKRSTSLKRKIKQLNKERLDGRLTDEQFVEKADEAIRLDEDARLSKDPAERQRGYLLIQEKLSAAARRGEISREAFDLANWFMSQNEDLVNDLGVSIRSSGKAGAGGFYNTLSRVFTLIKNGSSDLTTVHEILHHLERMMPAKVQQAIRKAWASQLAKATKQAKTPAEKLFFAALRDAHYGSNQHSMLIIPEGAGEAYSKVRKALEYEPGDGSSANFAGAMLELGLVPMGHYEYFNPSEFWAVNGSNIVKARYDAVQGGVLARLKNWLKELGQKIKSIFGMKSDASIIRALDSLAKSDGKFVTREMLGTGDYLSIERRNFRGNEAPEPTFEAPIPSALDTFAYNFLDKQHDMRSVIDEIQKVRGELVKEQVDPYLKNESFISRKAAREENFVDNSIMPIVQEMYKNKVSILEVEAYMHNRHAEERNIQVAKINPSLPDGGSGITTANALKYLTEIPENKLKIYNKIAKMFDGIVDDTQQILVESGAETQKTINDWNNTYEYYAPLQREDLDFINHGVGNGGGLGSRGSFSKRAFGSTKNVANILQNIVLQHKRAIDRAERIRVGKSLMGLVLTNPNPNFWIPVNPNAIKSIKKFKEEVQSLGISTDQAENMLQEPKAPSIDKETGLVKYAVNPAMRSMDNVFPVRINGQDWFIIFNPSDERAMRMVRSLKNLDVEKLGIFLGTAGMVTRWISAINTQYNPIFGAFNFGRDVGTGLLQLSTTELAGQQSKVRKSIMPALAAIFKEQRGWNKSKDVLDKDELTPQEWRDLYHRYRLAGGKTGISANFTQQKTRLEKLEKGWGIKGLLSVRATTDEISLLDKKLAEMDRGKIMAGAHYLFDYLSDYNEAMENAVRLATFKVAVLDNNMSDDKGASLAKNVTVNFDKKGAVVPKLQAWYSFINPGIRGAVLVKNVLTGPKGKIIIAGGIGLGIMQALLLFAAGFDDDDPPEFVKSKAFVIPTGGGKYFVMYPPYPPGFSMLPGIGRMLTEAFLIKSKAMKSQESASDKIFDILPMMFDSLNPLGIGATWQQLMPTPLDPIANVIVNKDAFGRPIAKTDRPGEETPGYERSRDSASSISKGIAYFLNWSSSPSGTLHTKGKISPTADQLDYFAEQYFGGVFREMVKAGESIGAKVKGEEQPMYRVPLAGKFFGETKTPAATSSRFYDNIEMLNAHEHEIKKRQEKREPTTEYLKENPEARLWKEANAAQKTIGNINKEKKAATERGASKATIDAINERKVKAMKAFNDRVRAAQ